MNMQDGSLGIHHVQMQESEANANTNERPSKRRCTTARIHREVGLMRNVRGDNFSGFVGSASGIYFIRSVYGALRRREHEMDVVDTLASDVVPGEDDQLPSVLPQANGHLWTHRELDPRTSSRYPYSQLVELSGSYFANWHLLYPFLHAPTVLGFFDELSTTSNKSPDTNDTKSHLQMPILRSIMSISLADQRQAGGLHNLRYPPHLIFLSYDAAINSLKDVLTQPTSILGLQAAISVQLFLISMLRLNAASRLGGLINRMALQLGLHRCPARYSGFSVTEKELRQRIFWSLYAIDRFICQSMGLPLGLNDDDIDVCFLNLERHVEGGRIPLQSEKLKMLNFVARESRLRGEIIELHNKSLHYVQRDPDLATAISAGLAEWWTDIEDFNDEDNDPEMAAYSILVLGLLKHESIISLHRPILAASHEGSEYDVALHLCVASARSIITMLHDALNSKNNTTPLTLLWPSCTWAVWISTFILFYAASNNRLSKATVTKLADRSLSVLQHLALRGSAWPEASATAIQDLRSRMLKSMTGTALGQHIDRTDQLETPAKLNTAAGQDTATASQDISRFPNDAEHGLSGRKQALAEDVAGQSGHVRLARFHVSAPALPMDANTAYMTGNTPFEDAFDMYHTGGNQSNSTNTDPFDPFSGFDIPFWLEQDQGWDIYQDFA